MWWCLAIGRGCVAREVEYQGGELCHVWRFQASKIVYCESFGDQAEALEAVGLSE